MAPRTGWFRSGWESGFSNLRTSPSALCAIPMVGTTILTGMAPPRKFNDLLPNAGDSSPNTSAEPRFSSGGQNDPGRFHSAAILDAHQAVTHRILPDRHARTGAPPSLHGFTIGATIADE